MNNGTKMIAVASFAFAFGIGASNFAMSSIPSGKVAVVDVPTIIKHSTEILEINREYETQIKEFQGKYNKAKEKISQITSEEEKAKLIKKYEDELTQEKIKIKKDSTQKMNKANASILKTIAKIAQEQGYDVVLDKERVLYAKNDITQGVLINIK